MEVYIHALLTALSPQVFFALVGGIVGILIKSEVDEYGWFYTIFISIGSIIAVGAISEYLVTVYSVESIFAHMFIGILVGIMGASILHAFNAFTPGFANKVVNKTGDKILNKVDDLIK